MTNQFAKLLSIIFMLAFVPLSISTSQAAQADELRKNFTYKIGDKGPGGGFIFFVDYFDQYPEFTYLEAAPEDISGTFQWCDEDNLSTLIGLNEWADNAVGKGQANMEVMLEVCNSGAANEADQYVSPNETSDWFLPSEGEMMLMYTNLRQMGVGSFADARYWSSTENSAEKAWYEMFNHGHEYSKDKDNLYRVRAARAF